jgi:hypothetical protein
VKYGVPQGSVFGPLLFLLMINDLPSSITSDCILFADDTSLINNFANHEQAHEELKVMKQQASDWFSANKLIGNYEKMQHLMCNNNNSCKNETSVKLLGFHIDSTLSWNGHISTICKKLYKSLFLIRRLKSCVPEEYLHTLISFKVI